MLLQKKLYVQVNTSSTTVGCGTLYQLGNNPKRIARLKEIKRMEEDGTFEVLPKKEVALVEQTTRRLEKFLGGIEDMPRIPDVMYVVDPHKEQIAC